MKLFLKNTDEDVHYRGSAVVRMLYHILEELGQDVGVQLVDRLHVVGDPGDDLAHRGEIKKAHGEALDVLKELPAHGVDDLLARLLQQQELGPVAHKQQRQHGHILPRRGQYAHKPLLHRLPGGGGPPPGAPPSPGPF